MKKIELKRIDLIIKNLIQIFIKQCQKLKTKVDPGTILQEIQAGYMLGERLLRPALVSVSKKKTSKDQENKIKKRKNRLVDEK